MKKIFNIFIAMLALVAVGCETGADDMVYEVSSDRVTIEANRRGIDSNGGQIILNVTSSTYWILNVDEATASWVEFTPKAAGAGTTEVFVTVKENEGEARVAQLMFDTQVGVKETVTINQRGSDEMLSYYCETFGEEAVAEDTNINRFDGWCTTGFGSNVLVYDGDLSISATNPSTIEGSSAGNSLYFGEEGLELVVGPISIYGDEFFRFSFNACNRNGAVSDAEFKMYAGDNGDDWFPFSYTVVEPAESGWVKVNADFSLKKDIATNIYLKLTAPAGYEIDDIVLVQGLKEDNAPMARVSMDSNPIGTVFFEDDLNWITPSFSNTIDAEIPFANGWSVCNMNMQSNALVPQASKDLWLSKRYTTPVDKGERTWNYAYVEVDSNGDGHFKIGRASQSNARNHTGEFYLPEGILSKIDQDARISVLFSLDVARFNTGDCNLLYVTAHTPGQDIDEKEIAADISAVKVFGTFEVSFDNVTRDTTFSIKTKVQTDARSIRLAFDNFKITKL
ncbi:MAG: BACON domain-containing protein [Alistipes sp.]|nr:BACON domain-containing protein [Alistipes sp.]